MTFSPAQAALVAVTAERRTMSEMARCQDTLRKLAMIDEAFVRDETGLELGPRRTPALDARTASLLQLAVSVAIGSPGACLEWSTTRALAAGATDDEIADVLLVIAPVAGLGRVVCAAPDVATALGYDIAAALEDPDR
jgi:4-carboxymuconolactone decarboxylase